MKAYLTAYDEKTTVICLEQLEKFGFDVVVLGEKETWIDKYKLFIEIAEGPCIRVDADIIVNGKIKEFAESFVQSDAFFPGAQAKCYCMYKNGLIDGVVFYTQTALDYIKANLHSLDAKRPEASAWRLPELNGKIFNSAQIVGMHGFFQDREHFDRAMKHKIERKQIEHYDFDLSDKLMNL